MDIIALPVIGGSIAIRHEVAFGSRMVRFSTVGVLTSAFFGASQG
jgi:hypothetical protein